MYGSVHSPHSPEHRARELLNLVTLARRCARLPGIADDERRVWQLEADRAWQMARPLLPRLNGTGETEREVLALAAQVAAEMTTAM